MTLRKSWLVGADTAGVGATAKDARLSHAGSYVRHADGTVRAGVLGYRSGIVASRADMAVDVGRFEAVLTRGVTDGVNEIANDGTITIALPAAPSSGTRWVRVYALQRDNVDAADSDNAPVLLATAASTSLPALPVGALPIARILQPANVLGTDDCTVIEDFPMTAAAGGVVPVRNSTERDSVAWLPGQEIMRLDTLALQVWNGYGFARLSRSGASDFRQYVDTGGYVGGGLVLATFTILAAPFLQRVELDVDGMVAPQSAGNAGVGFTTTAGSITAMSAARVYTGIGSQFYGFSRGAHVNLPGNTGATIQVVSEQSVPSWHSLVCKARVLAQGEY